MLCESTLTLLPQPVVITDPSVGEVPMLVPPITVSYPDEAQPFTSAGIPKSVSSPWSPLETWSEMPSAAANCAMVSKTDTANGPTYASGSP